MIEEKTSVARPEFVAAWVAGWALSRGLAPPVPAYGGLRVDVGLPDQKARYVFAEAGDGVRLASAAILGPHVFLKVCAAPDAVTPLLAGGWSLKPPSFLMTTDELGADGCGAPDGYTLTLEHMAAGAVAICTTVDSEPAASGRVVIVGATAVFDRIETHPDQRRRGLGRAIMNALAAQARRRGATTGALVATSDGRALYATMGWWLYTLYTTALRD